MRFTSVAVAVMVIGAMLGGCGGNSAGRLLSNEPTLLSEGSLTGVTAEWLRAQPGIQLDEFSFHMLDNARQPVADWQGLSIERRSEASLSFSLACNSSVPDDIYLYIAYPPEQYICQEARLDDSCSDEFIFLAMPDIEPGVLTVGLSRIGPRRSTALSASDLAHFGFAPGQEPVTRSLSQVNTDPKSAVELTAFYANEGGVVALYWDERNTGDYNNNSLVEITDITPLGFYYDQEVQAADEPEKLLIVDGNLDGWITINDLTQIGANWQRRIEGYKVYQATVVNPILEDFAEVTPWEPATVIRADVFAATIEAERNERLGYITEVDNPPTAELHFIVRAFSADGGETTLGPPSNIATPPVPSNNAPIWMNHHGLVDAVGIVEGIHFTWGEAIDPDGDAVTYEMSYAWVMDLVEDDWQPLSTSGEPPWESEVYGLMPGEDYAIVVRALDDQFYPAYTSDNKIMTVHIPALGESDEPWPHFRHDAQRTGCNPNSALTEPLGTAWTVDQGGSSIPSMINTPLLAENYVIIGDDNDSRIRRYALSDGIEEYQASAEMEHLIQFWGALGHDYVVWGNSGYIASVVGSQGPVYTNAEYDDGNLPLFNCTAPMLLGDFAYFASAGGMLVCTNADGLNTIWLRDYIVVSDMNTACADDSYMYLYHTENGSRLDKIDLLTGNIVASVPSAVLRWFTPALDIGNGRLYFSTEHRHDGTIDWLVEYSTDDLSETRRFSNPDFYWSNSDPCLVLDHSPPLAVVGVTSLTEGGGLLAFNLDTGDTAWESEGVEGYRATFITSNSERIFVNYVDDLANPYADIYVYDFSGNLRQRFVNSVPRGRQGEIALSDDRAVLNAGYELHALEQEQDNPPTWVDTVGVTSLEAGDGSITAHWGDAGDEYGEVVSYAIYYSDIWPVEFVAPYSYTTVVPGLGEDVRSHTITSLDNDTCYWVAVRAYDGIWGIDENLEQNMEVLSITPPWQREELILGTDLPAGEIYFMYGLVDPTGGMHLVYNDETDTHLTHVWGDTGAWQNEGSGLAEHSAIAFEPAWDTENNRLALGWATTTDVGVLVRTGEDTWSKTTFPDTLPGINPQVSLAIGNEWALAYTHDMWGGPVENEVDYYLKRTVGGAWQAYEPLEETNLSGRDIDLVLAPDDGVTPWAAMQHGRESTPNRHTPEEGECMYAWWDNGGASWDYDTLDAGDDAPDSDCGKRVQQVLDDAGNPHLAYLDLDADPLEPWGQLKYAYFDGAVWHVERVSSFSLFFQDDNSLQYTWGELGFALVDDGMGGQQPLIAKLARSSGSEEGEPHGAIAQTWLRLAADDWKVIQLTDEEWVFPRDREPCVLLVTPDGVWHVFYATTQDQTEPAAADSLVHLWRPVLSV